MKLNQKIPYIIGITLIIISSLVIYLEIKSAIKFCESEEKVYQIINFQHYCGDKEIFKFYNTYYKEKYWGYNPNNQFKLNNWSLID